MTTETIKANYDACRLSYEAALLLLESLGMSSSEADNYLADTSQLRPQVE